jgi:hypothetical protein
MTYQILGYKELVWHLNKVVLQIKNTTMNYHFAKVALVRVCAHSHSHRRFEPQHERRVVSTHFRKKRDGTKKLDFQIFTMLNIWSKQRKRNQTFSL